MRKLYRIKKDRSSSDNICLYIVLHKREPKTRRNYLLYLEFYSTYFVNIKNNYKRITSLPEYRKQHNQHNKYNNFIKAIVMLEENKQIYSQKIKKKL